LGGCLVNRHFHDRFAIGSDQHYPEPKNGPQC
jgi:hypothetical protein